MRQPPTERTCTECGVTKPIDSFLRIRSTLVTVDGTNTECLFTAAGELVLVRRMTGYFDDSASGATVEQVDQLRLLIGDDLDYTPVVSVADAAFFATVHDRSLASQRLAVLITKRGADACVIGVMDTPEALSTATPLTHAVLDGQAP